MKTNLYLNPNSRITLGKILGENPLVKDKLVSSMYFKVAKSVTETNSKICELKTYDKIINNPIIYNRQLGAIDKELWNLNIY